MQPSDYIHSFNPSTPFYTPGTRNDEELRTILCTNEECKAGILSFRRDFFLQKTEVDSPTGRQIQRLLPLWLRTLLDPLLGLLFDNKVVNLDTEHFKACVYENLGDYTFQEAFDRTGRIINITVAPMNNYDPPRWVSFLFFYSFVHPPPL